MWETRLLTQGGKSSQQNIGQQSVKELDVKHLKPEFKTKMKEEIRKHKEEQLILLKENKRSIINFLIDNKDSIRVEDLQIYEPIYKCYREKGNCYICNRLSNISCKNCNSHHNNKEVGLCTNHWKQHLTQHHQYIE
jgi:hypothetical protein